MSYMLVAYKPSSRDDDGSYNDSELNFHASLSWEEVVEIWAQAAAEKLAYNEKRTQLILVDLSPFQVAHIDDPRRLCSVCDSIERLSKLALARVDTIVKEREQAKKEKLEKLRLENDIVNERNECKVYERLREKYEGKKEEV